MTVAIIGAGAAGCFCAIETKRRMPDADVTVYEAGSTPLAKVAVTGGGRCNFTNSFRDISRLEDAYPRGARLMKRALNNLSNKDTIEWFAREGVASVIQEDQCVFPRTQDAMHIVRVLMNLMRRLGVKVETGHRIEHITDIKADAVVVTCGGCSKASLHRLTEGLDIELVEPVPSLFTFRIDDASLRSLMGAVIDDVTLSLAGTGFRSQGTLLLTDWGVSGPATLKLSSYAARHLAENGYKGTLLINWLDATEGELRPWLSGLISENGRKQLSTVHPQELSSRVWQHLLARCGFRPDLRCAEIGSKGMNRLVNTLVADSYGISGRCSFKEEFVTAGGISLNSINLNTLECRNHPGLYFAGEILDVDAITGGFNLQAAWSTGYTAAKSICR